MPEPRRGHPGFDTERLGGFVASPGWATLFVESDRILDFHAAEAGHPVYVSIESKARIDYQGECCDELHEALLPIERASARTCQACGRPGEREAYLVECGEHRGQWPYDVDLGPRGRADADE